MAKRPPDMGTTEERILDAAMRIFAELGYEGARVDEIAKQAQANKAAIYYHIGGKEEVYAKILERTFTTFAQRVSESVQEAATPEEQLRAYIRGMAQNIREQPHMPTIMMREMAAGAQHLPEAMLKELSKLIGLLTNILRDGEEQGVFVPVTPLLIHLMLVGGHLLSKTVGAVLLRHSAAIPAHLLTAYQHFPETAAGEIEEVILRAVKRPQ